MNCPHCGHPCDDCYCDPPLTEAKATRAAQRQAAAKRIMAWYRAGYSYSFNKNRLPKKWRDAIDAYRIALRDLGISRPAGRSDGDG